ncbi:MAG: HDIG domain-containing protein [Deltaproteobacteria bacterium]|nr:HDIG domain-containing protein [Deltaproteobacteria bacterium]
MKMRRDKRAHRTFGDVFGRISSADFSSLANLKSSPILGWGAFVFLCLAITFLMTFSISSIPDQLLVGAIAQRDIRADRNYEIIDRNATDKFIEEADESVLRIYDYNPLLGQEIAANLGSALEQIRSRLVAGENAASLKSLFESSLAIALSDREWENIVSSNFNKQFELAVSSQIQSAMSRPVSANIDEIAQEKIKGITLRDSDGNEKMFGAKEISNIVSVDELKNRINTGRYLSKKGMNTSAGLAALLVQPNFSFNMQETEARRRAAAENVKSVIIKVEAGEMIIRAGSRYEPRHIIILEGIRAEKEKASTPFEVAGTLLLVALVIISSFYFAERYIRKFAPQKTDLYLMGLILIFILIILRLSIGLSRAIHDSVDIEIPLTAFYYAIPLGGAAMLVRFILNSETALVFSIVSSIFAGVFVGNSLNYTGYCLISSIAAAASIAYADKRSSILRAGLSTAAVNIFAALGIQLVNATSLAEPLTFLNIVWCVLFAIIGGLSCAVIVTLVTPFIEALFGYTTDIKLLELANLNHPLLRELVIRAPGTYHHSHLVGILAETASEAIGANPLFARVAAYYHDIGKIRKPLYFVENTADSESRHEKLSPHMSALIISSHVKDGLELAAQYKIPRKIADVIPQHHGTKLIGFFFKKAKKDNDPELQKLEEKDFRYQGPKPQTREAGILLLADAVEAAVRSLKEKSPARIQQTVEDMINSSFTEAQLDECDLTLRNLHDIAKSFTKILMGIYHQRIEYPKEMFQNSSENGVVKGG